jgi:CO/xanthine dehydrogenase FAD-binding subunit
MRVAAPTTIDGVLTEITANGAEPIAGGTDLVVGVRAGKRMLPEALVAIHGVEELRQLEQRADGGLRIGATVSHETLYESPLIREGWSAIADGSALVGSAATRSTGTIGGNVANASPAMDTGAPLAVLDAEVVVRGAAGERRIPIDEVFLGPGRSAVEPNELLVAVELPPSAAGAASSYVRLEYRQAMEIAVVGAAAWVRLADGGEHIAEARIALSAVAPTIVRAEAAERLLDGSGCDFASLQRAAEVAAEAANPIGDNRASAEYRLALVPVIVRRALEAAVTRASGGEVAVPASRGYQRREGA